MDAFAWEVIGSLAAVAGVLVAIFFGLRGRNTDRTSDPQPALPSDPQPAIPPPGERRSFLSRGQSLSAGKSLYSPDGHTKFTLLGDGNMVVDVVGVGDICDTGTTNLGVPKCLKLESDGSLILYDADNNPLRVLARGGVRLQVQDNSHVVLVPPAGFGDAVWATERFFKGGQLVTWIPPEERWPQL